jgi:Secretion system C-terminal sorting domain
MKKIVAFFIIFAPMLLMAQANTIDIGIFNVPANSNKFEIRIKPIQNLSGGYSAGVFTVRFPSAYGVSLSTISSPFGYFIQTIALNQNGNDYYSFVMANFFTVSWLNNQEYVIATIQHSNNGSGNGLFQIVNDTWTAANLGDYYQELNGSDAQRNIYSSATAPLPLDLISFNAKGLSNRTVALDWRTHAENGVAKFVVEYSTDRLSFNPIGERLAKGGLNAFADYDLIDPNPINGDNYYRLKIINNDGTFEYSPVRLVVFEEFNSATKIQPNPTFGPFNLIYTAYKEEDLKISISDVNGRLVKETNLVASKGVNTFDFKDSNLLSGVYTVSVTSQGGNTKVQRLVVLTAP